MALRQEFNALRSISKRWFFFIPLFRQL